MLKRDLVVLRTYDKNLVLYSNLFSDWYDLIAYYKDSNKEDIKTIRIKDREIIIPDLEDGEYTFYAINEDNGVSSKLHVNLEEKDLCAQLSSSLSDEYLEVLLKYEAELDSSSIIYSVYALLDSIEDEDERELVNKALYSLVKYHNDYQIYLNQWTDDFRILVSHDHILVATSNDEKEFTNKMVVKIEKLGATNKAIVLEKVEENTYTRKLDRGLYLVSFFQEDSLINEFYFYSNPDDSNKKYSDIIKELTEKSALTMSSISNLPSDWEFNSEEEKTALVNLFADNYTKALFSRPKLEYIDGMISVILPEDICSFINTTTMHKYYLCGISEDDIYSKNASPLKIEIRERCFEFVPWNYFILPEAYYFYIADENSNRISETTYLCLGIDSWSDEEGNAEDAIDYNNRFQEATWNRYVKNLYDIVSQEKANLWPTVKNTLDACLISENVGYIKPIDNMINKVLETWNDKYGNIAWIIYYLYLCEYKNYTNQDRKFMKEQYRSDYYSIHQIPKGNYILCIIRIKDNEITRDYIYNPTESSNFRYDTSDYIIFYCINPEDYKISDFGFYNNTEYRTNFKYNSLIVEKV